VIIGWRDESDEVIARSRVWPRLCVGKETC
jgi:hypothetical protein